MSEALTDLGRRLAYAWESFRGVLDHHPWCDAAAYILPCNCGRDRLEAALADLAARGSDLDGEPPLVPP